MATFVRRWAWLAVLAVGLALYLLVLDTLVSTQNPNFIPSMILLGATVVPASFVTFAAGRSGRWQVPASMLGAAALFGGVIGTVVAGRLEYDTLRELGVMPMLAVGLIEESAKLVVPGVLLAVLWRRREVTGDGLVIGVAVGMGFAALETMGYAFVVLITSHGNIGDVEQTLLVRGLLSPAGHMAWTGLTCTALWQLAASPTRSAVAALIGTFLAVVALHTAWDSLGGLAGYLLIGGISVGWLLWRLHRTGTVGPPGSRPLAVATPPAVDREPA